MEAFLNIKYKQVSTDQYEDFLKFNNVGMILRKTALTVSPVSLLTMENGVYTLALITSFRTINTVFKLNEEFDEDRADGNKVKTIFTVEGNTLIQIQTEASGKKFKHVREFSADKLIVKSTADGWDGVCTRIFERIN